MLAGVAGVAGVPADRHMVRVCTSMCVFHRSCVPSLTGCSVIDRDSTAGQDGGDAGRGNPCRHVQQGLDDVTLEDGVLLPQVQDPHDLTL